MRASIEITSAPGGGIGRQAGLSGKAWANKQKISAYRQFVLSSPVFGKYEVSRSVHLMFTLNVCYGGCTLATSL